MHDINNRRAFLKTGAAVAASGWIAGNACAQDPAAGSQSQQPSQQGRDETRAEYDGFSRYSPSRGTDPDNDYYLGKLVPGFRTVADGPVPFVAPDLEKLPWEMKDGVKEFHLVCQPVQRELLPGYSMRFYGFNGSMPGPTIEVNQGDRVRIVVTNELTEETSVHWHGFELKVQFDGAETLTQNPIKPGHSFVYELDVHEAGTFFYHSHVPMQEAFGMVGWFIVHPREVYSPPVDRDFGLLFQNFFIDANQTVPDSWRMDWNWHTMNGRSGPFSTPLVVQHGERVRIRLLNFSPMQHHPIHMHGHTFWVSGHEGSRAPKSAWIPRNNELVGIAQASEFEFIANNPGDWMLHCHMVHHMMNHMVQQVGPRIREESSVDQFLESPERRPAVELSTTAASQQPPGYPQKMLGMNMDSEAMMRLWSRREVKGMRATFLMSLMGLMTAVRVLPNDLYERVMNSDEEIPKGAIFEEIVKRYGDPTMYEPAPMHQTHGT